MTASHLDGGQGVAQGADHGRQLEGAAEARGRAQHGPPEHRQRVRLRRRGGLCCRLAISSSGGRRCLRLHDAVSAHAHGRMARCLAALVELHGALHDVQ